MIVLFLHGWNSRPGGVKPTYLAEHGHTVLNPELPDEDFAQAVLVAQAAIDAHSPDVIVGSSRGGAVAMNVEADDIPLVLMCPAWTHWGMVRRVKQGTVILHAEADDVISIEDSRELVRHSRLPESSLIVVGNDHRMADAESLDAMLSAIEQAVAPGIAPPKARTRTSAAAS